MNDDLLKYATDNTGETRVGLAIHPGETRENLHKLSLTRKLWRKLSNAVFVFSFTYYPIYCNRAGFPIAPLIPFQYSICHRLIPPLYQACLGMLLKTGFVPKIEEAYILVLSPLISCTPPLI